MRSVVYKYPVRPDKAELTLPRGARPLTVQIQHGELQMWVQENPDEVLMDIWEVYIVGTGHVHDDLDEYDYLTTFQTGSVLVWHVFIRNMADD
jgi:hypothetical protein